MVFDEGPLPAEGEQPESSDQEPGQPITNSPSSSREGKVDAGAKTGGGREEVPSLSLPSLSQKALPVVANLGAPGTRPDSQGSNASGWETAREHLPEIIDSGRKEKEDERKQAEALKRQKKLRLDHGRAKKTPKRQMDAHLDELVALMNQEWTQIAKMATSLKSGTGVVEEALLRKLHITIRKINLLCLKNNEAAEHMIYRVKRLANKEVQLLMKMFDAMDHPLLTDFVRTCVSNSSRLQPLGHRSRGQKASAASTPIQKALRSSKPNVLEDEDSHASLPGPKPEDLMVFTRPSLKSDFTDSGFRWGTAPEHVKGWISSGFCARVRADKGVLKEALPEIRHQLLSGWSTGAPVYNSMLFIDPVNGHSHTPVYPPYDSDDEDAILAVNQQIARMKELSSKIQRSKLEDREIQKKLAALTTKTQEVSEAVDETSSVGSYRSS